MGPKTDKKKNGKESHPAIFHVVKSPPRRSDDYVFSLDKSDTCDEWSPLTWLKILYARTKYWIMNTIIIRAYRDY